MKKKLSSYILLLGLLGSFFVSPITALAESTNSQVQSVVPIKETENQETSTIMQKEIQHANSTTKQPTGILPNTGQSITSQTVKQETAQPRAPTVRAQDVSNNITSINAVPEKVTDGGITTVRVNFDEHAQDIQSGDTITVNWPNSGDVYGTGYAKTVDIYIDGVKVGVLTVTADKAVITFNDNINDLDHVIGWVEFDVKGSNVTQTTEENTGSFTVSGGGQSDNVLVEKPAAGGSGTFYYKTGDMLPNDTDHVRWFLNINNEKKSVADRIAVSDQIQAGQSLKIDSFDISISGNKNDHFYGPTAIADFEAAYPGATISADVSAGTIEVFIPQNLASYTNFRILYLTNIEDYDQDSFKNDSQVWYQESGQEPVNGAESDFIVDNVDAGGGIDGDNQTSVSVKKVWEDQNNQDGIRPNEIKVQLYADGQKQGDEVALNQANQWGYTWKKLTAKHDGQLIKYTVKEVGNTDGYVTTVDDNDKKNVIITNTHTPSTTAVNGTKTWQDHNDQDGKRPTEITVNLLANGKVVQSQVVTAKENWQYSFTDLPEYADGTKIIYTITENAVKDYTTKINNYDLTNSYTPEKTSMTVTKAWDDHNDQDGIRPTSIKVQLYADGQKQGAEVRLTQATNWTHSWTGLDAKQNGKTIKYTVKEVGTTNDYVGTVDDHNRGNVLITNTHQPSTIDINGTKTWQDQNNQDGVRPTEITVNLLANGKVVQSQVVTAKENWQYSFTDLPEYASGTKIIYTVTENAVDGYTTQINGYDLTNHYAPEKTSMTVTKAWDDQGNQDGIRPTSIKVQLYADGQKQGAEVTLKQATKWTYNWTDLAAKQNGKAVQYTVKEVGTSKGYIATIDDSQSENIIITNTHTPSVTEISGTKTWQDDNDRDGVRPTEITVNLLANGKVVQSQVVTAKENWQYRFTDLPEYINGTKIIYTITENAVDGYTTQINGYDLTNRYTPEKTSMTVTKAWDDHNDQTGIRPTSIKVQLYADGQKQGAEVTLKQATKWTHNWTNLAIKQNGKAIQYTVKEVGSIKGYVATVNDSDPQNVLITNTHTVTAEMKPLTPTTLTKTPDTPKTQPTDKPQELPQTGEKSVVWLIVLGIVLILIVIAYSIKRHYKK